MSLILTMPGKLGDALLQWPVGRAICRQRGEKARVWLDEITLGPLVTLFAAQPEVEAVELKPGISDWSCGGQPWDFGLKTEDHIGHEIVHLGLRKFPDKQITLKTVDEMPYHLDVDAICQEPSLEIPEPMMAANRVVLHGTFQSHMAGVPGFWKFLNSIKGWIGETFSEATFVGTESERKRAADLYGPISNGCLWDSYGDQGSFLEVARLLKSARLVIGCGSSVVALAGALKIPCVRVHDPIGEYPKMLWANLGPHQLNATELELRKGEWARFRDQLFPQKQEVA